MGEVLNHRPGFDSGANAPAGSDSIHIAIVDDHELFLSGIGGLIRQMDSRFVVAGYARGSDLIESLKTGSPKLDLLITDLTMKQVNGLALAAAVRQLLPLLPIIMVSGVEDALSGQNLTMLGINGFVAKSASEPTLRAAIVSALESTDKGFGRQAKRPTEQPILPDLAPRQRQIVSLVASGATNREISEALNISENTVKSHLKDVFAELGVTSRTAAVRRARELGFL